MRNVKAAPRYCGGDEFLERLSDQVTARFANRPAAQRSTWASDATGAGIVTAEAALKATKELGRHS